MSFASKLTGRISSGSALLVVLVLMLAAARARAQSGSNALWQAQSIYQIFTDRFFDGDAANNNASSSYNASSGTSVHGGDFKGVEQKLDYLKALGATAIWISPVVRNGFGEYHGYSGRDFYSVDPHWGTLSNLQAMVNAAHARGLLVIQDVVVNHGSTLNNINGNTAFSASGYSLSYSGSTKYAAPFNTNAANPNLTNLFHNFGAISDYNNVQQLELGELSGLDDFRTESAYVRTNMAAIYNFWITNAGFDGFRIDTVKHCELGFWQDWCPRIHSFAATNGWPNFFMFGEVFDGSDAKNGSYSGTNGGGPFKLDSLLDYPLFFAAQSVFEWGGNTKQIEDHYNALAANYDPNVINQLVTFLDNHDTTRFLNSANANGDTNKLRVALSFLYTSRGIPCLYQGTEQAFDGGADPGNREDMFDGAFEQGPSLGDNFNMTHPMFQHVAKLNNFRRLYPALSGGVHVNLWYDPDSAGLFAYARRLGAQEAFVVFNTAAITQSLPARPTSYAAGTTLVNLLDTNETFVVQSGSVTPTINVPAMTAKLFIDQAQLLPLDPVVVSASPAHDTTNVSALAPVLLQFSQPMETNSVQAALTLTPNAAKTFAWSGDARTLTVSPVTNWPGTNLITVRIADTAQASATTNRLFAAFEARFRTGLASDLVAPTVVLVSPTNGAVAAGVLAVSGTASDNLSVAKVEVQVDGLGWVQASGTTAWSYALNTANYLNGLHAISARSTDGGGNVSTTATASVRFINVPGAYAQRLACGNSSNITDCASVVWPRDTNYVAGSFGYIGGAPGFVASTVTGICANAQSLYQRERFSTFSYQFDCPIGVYETTLLEAETYWSAPGQRLFNVFIQGAQVLTNLDIFAAAGGKNLPLTLTFTNSVTNSQLVIAFAPVVDNARVSGVQVRKIGDVFSDSDGIPDWWRLAYYSHATGQAGDLSRGTDDADGDGMANVDEYRAGTDPLNAASVFVITKLDLSTGTNVQLSVSAVTNRTYQLQRSEGVTDLGGWLSVGAPLTTTSNRVMLVDPEGATNAGRIYRVRSQ
ncbi:MAG: hypothetical protein RLY20_525 [Verrucomicrobiota bacterium]